MSKTRYHGLITVQWRDQDGAPSVATSSATFTVDPGTEHVAAYQYMLSVAQKQHSIDGTAVVLFYNLAPATL